MTEPTFDDSLLACIQRGTDFLYDAGTARFYFRTGCERPAADGRLPRAAKPAKRRGGRDV